MRHCSVEFVAGFRMHLGFRAEGLLSFARVSEECIFDALECVSPPYHCDGLLACNAACVLMSYVPKKTAGMVSSHVSNAGVDSFKMACACRNRESAGNEGQRRTSPFVRARCCRRDGTLSIIRNVVVEEPPSYLT